MPGGKLDTARAAEIFREIARLHAELAELYEAAIDPNEPAKPTKRTKRRKVEPSNLEAPKVEASEAERKRIRGMLRRAGFRV